MACSLWVTEIFMKRNLEPLQDEHVHAHRYMNAKPSRHPHHVLTLFHLCRRKQQHSGPATCIRESNLHQALGRLIIREKRCCPWIQCMTNSGDVYFTALTVHTMSPRRTHACCRIHDGETKKADDETQRCTACNEPQRWKEMLRGRQEYKKIWL